MPAPLPADWPGIRLLATQGHTLEELSQMFGIAIGTLCARSAREGWKEQARMATETRQSKAVAIAVQKGQMQGSAISAADTTVATLAQRQKHTKLELSMYAARASRVAARMPKAELLARSGEVKAVADVMAKLWPEQAQDAGMHVSFFSISTAQDTDMPSHGTEKSVAGHVVDEQA